MQDPNLHEIKYSILKDYLEGDPSPEIIEQVISWFQDPEYRFRLEQILKEYWKETGPDKIVPRTAFDVMLDGIHHKINQLLSPANRV